MAMMHTTQRPLVWLAKATLIVIIAGGCTGSSTPTTGGDQAGSAAGLRLGQNSDTSKTTPPAKLSPKDTESQPGGQPSSFGVPDFKLTADELAAAQKNAKSAEAKYKGKVIELTGTVSSRGEKSARGYSLSFQIGPEKEIGPGCFFPKLNVTTKVLPGQTARVVGRYTELSAVTGDLEDCELLEVGPNNAIRISAEELAKEYASDWKKAANKYHGHGMVVTGEITKKENRGDFQLFVTLKGQAGVDVVCEILTLHRDSLEKQLKTGSNVKLTARFASSQKYKMNSVTLENCLFIEE